MQNVKLAGWSSKVRKGLQWRRQWIIEKDPTLDKTKIYLIFAFKD